MISRDELIREFWGLDLGDNRINNRLDGMLTGFLEHPGQPISRCFVSSAEVKAAYRFFENDKVDATVIKDHHRLQTLSRMQQYDEVLIIQDTTFLDYGRHLHKEGLGSIGSKSKRSSSGLLVHHALATTMEGVPLGLLDQNVWARGKKADGKESLKWLTAVEKTLASELKHTRLITVADREADKNAVIDLITELKGSFVIRAKNTRISGDQYKRKTIEVLREFNPVTSYEIEVIDRDNVVGKIETNKKRLQTTRRKTKLLVRSGSLSFNGFNKPINAILISEENPPADANEIEWFLLTDLPVETAEDAMKIISIYGRRWTVELFHKSLKTGCAAEECRLKSAKKIEVYLAMISIVAWWLLYLQKLSRIETDLPADKFFDETEMRILASSAKSNTNLNLKEAVYYLCALAGYKKTKRDDEPGIYSIWLGWLALQQGVDLLRKLETPSHMGSR